MKKEGYVTVEMAVVMGVYLTIIGSLISMGIHLYQVSQKEAKEVVEILTVEELCKRRRMLKMINDCI